MKKNTLLSFFNRKYRDEEEDGGIVLSLANLFKCMFFTHPKPNEEKIHLIQIEESLKDISTKVTQLEKNLSFSHKKKASLLSLSTNQKNLEVLNEEADELMSNDSMRVATDDEDDFSLKDLEPKRDDMVNPYWIEDKDLLNGEVCQLPEKEVEFWNDLIKKYLHPLDEDKAQQAKIAADLIDLRNRVVFGFLMVNALFILVVFLLQLNKDILHVEWPFGVRENITFIPETNEIRVEKFYLQMEPIGLVFVLFFGTILAIQFVGMLFHRFATLSHILASVELFDTKKKLSKDDELPTNAIEMAKRIQRLKNIDIDDEENYRRISNDLRNRNIVERCEERKHVKRQNIGTLDVAFRKRFAQISKNELSTPILGRRNSEDRKPMGFLDSTMNENTFNLDSNPKPFIRSNARGTLDKKQKKKRFNNSSSTSAGPGNDNPAFSLEGEHYDLNNFSNFSHRNEHNEMGYANDENTSYNSNHHLFHKGSNL